MEPLFAVRVARPSSRRGMRGRSAFSEFLSTLSRVADRGSAAAHSSSTPGHRNRGFYRPISRGNPLDARCETEYEIAFAGVSDMKEIGLEDGYLRLSKLTSTKRS